MPTSELLSGGVLRVRVADDLELDGGAWAHTGEHEGWLIATITPPAVPMFQQVVEYLETKPVPRGGNSRRANEARAAVAVCLRWGSYFAVLADPARPDAPAIADEQVSHIDDVEMARLNIEISAALAWWLTLRGADDRRYWDLVHRALEYLPTGPKTFGPLQGGDRLLVCTMPEMAAHVRGSWPVDRLDRDLKITAVHGVRIIANTITHIAWRNGPIENVHAGRFQGYDLDLRRVLPKAEKAIIRHAQRGFSTGLKAVDFFKYDDAWPPPAERVLPFVHGLIGPKGWSCTEQSRTVELLLRLGRSGSSVALTTPADESPLRATSNGLGHGFGGLVSTLGGGNFLKRWPVWHCGRGLLAISIPANYTEGTFGIAWTPTTKPGDDGPRD